MDQYKFFTGLTDEGVEDTLEGYAQGGAWGVVSFGENADGFWMLLGKMAGMGSDPAGGGGGVEA